MTRFSKSFVPTTAAAIAGLTLLTSATADAQPYIHLSSTPDLSGSPTLVSSTPFVPFNIYVVADGFSEAGIGGIAGAEWSLNLPVGFSSVGLTLPPGAINVGSIDNVISGFGGVLTEPAVIGTYSIVNFAGFQVFDGLMTLGPSTPSSVDGTGPVYLDNFNSVENFSFSSGLRINKVFEDTPELYPIPEPATLSLLTLGSLALVMGRRRK